MLDLFRNLLESGVYVQGRTDLFLRIPLFAPKPELTFSGKFSGKNVSAAPCSLKMNLWGRRSRI